MLASYSLMLVVDAGVKGTLRVQWSSVLYKAPRPFLLF